VNGRTRSVVATSAIRRRAARVGSRAAARSAGIAALSVCVALALGCDEAILSLLPPSAAVSNSSEADAGAVNALEAGRETSKGPDATIESTAADAGGDAAAETAASPSQYLGCFGDSPNPNLSHFAYSDPTNTTEHCVSTCMTQGYLYAGTRAGNECYCANVYGGQGPSTNCTTLCGGNASETCGGTTANSVYYTTVPPSPPPYLGCFTDSMMHDLPYQAYDSHSNTVEDCIAACTYHAYLYAGTQSYTQCFCGDTYGGQGISMQCNTSCTGNPSETCGGVHANSVYRTTALKDAGGGD
jgi:hypothetical protein